MKIVKPSFEILTTFNPKAMLKRIEAAGRTCYKSEDKVTDDSASKFVKMIVKRGHLSVLEHESISVRVICDRGVSHEIVRHRIGAYSQESTRYCSYGGDVAFIEPPFDNLTQKSYWEEAMQVAEDIYHNMLDAGATPQIARSVLPNSLKTEIVITYNLRQWLHFFSLRCSEAAHPQMREIALHIQNAFQTLLPDIFM